MSKNPTENQIDVWGMMLRIHSNALISIESDLSKARQISLVKYDVLLVLKKSEKGKLRMSEIVERGVLTKSGLSRCISSLEKEGLIRKEACENDGRSYFAVLTEKGRKALREAWPIYKNGIENYFLKSLSDVEITRLGKLFSKILS